MIIITSNHLTHPGIHFNKMPTYGQHSETTALKCKDWRPVGPPGYGCKGYLLNNNLFLLYLFIEQQHLFLSYCIYLLNNTISSCCIYLLNHTSSYCVYLLNLLCLFIEQHHLFLLCLFTEHHHLPPEVSVLGIHHSDQVLAGIWRNSTGSILETGCRPSREGTMPSSPLHQEGLQDERQDAWNTCSMS